ncbi:YihY/virulence factor BrkB family protein [Frankia sp. R82]|uniref:YihY/virulence factor BrkB family protein n=1 Tax=Frankia sp. R82 TaxID=2950553 RepID=UPI0020435883|nr:YihY/virulence factor BrkB family protein [Frankia sp. R82]MCM3884360.1 YihY/virulence factor BrkB family protein [Frankia sp. R82]
MRQSVGDLFGSAEELAYYAATPIVPGVLVAIRLIDLLLGEAHTRELGRSLLTFVYRVVGPGRPAWTATLCAAGATGSFVAGFLQGFVLFLSFTLDLGLPFGGFSPVGAAVAVGFWLFLLHLIVLVGYGPTLRLGEMRLGENRSGSACATPTSHGLLRTR